MLPIPLLAVLLALRVLVPALVAPAPFPVAPETVRRAGATALVIDLVALASVWRSRSHSVKARLLWTAVVAVLPVLGAAAWFVLGRERRRARATRA